MLEEAAQRLPVSFQQRVARMMDHLKEMDHHVGELELQIKAWHRSNDLSSKLEKVPGIGPITASALVATIGDARNFKNCRQLAAWLGLVPRQHSTGGKSTLLGISARRLLPSDLAHPRCEISHSPGPGQI